MKKGISMIILCVFLLGTLAGCGSGAGEPQAASGSQSAGQTEQEEKIQIVTTIYPIYDWVRNLLGENAPHAEVSLLIDNGVDPHSYQPTVDDILKISGCDLFLYVGGESDAWVEDAIEKAVNPEIIPMNLLEVLGDSVKEEEEKEGMQVKENGAEEEKPEYDEHIWLSLRNAETVCSRIEETLEEMDPDCAKLYQNNLAGYLEELKALDAEYETAVSEAPVKTLLFGDRFPFRYLTDDYGLDYYAAFAGCSAETGASFETITFLADKVDELSLPAVMTIEGSDHRLAETIVQATETKDQQILTLDSMQSTTKKDIQEGRDYLSVMKENLDVLKEALK